ISAGRKNLYFFNCLLDGEQFKSRITIHLRHSFSQAKPTRIIIQILSYKKVADDTKSHAIIVPCSSTTFFFHSFKLNSHKI
ncbi:hypothetical protein LIR06_14770, partial [Mediterraneibacter faecis]|uniref:hypothetical protein n=1 Tax=Mediterraneibacter faecis TaxID=592978 RepID=UPI001D01567A